MATFNDCYRPSFDGVVVHSPCSLSRLCDKLMMADIGDICDVIVEVGSEADCCVTWYATAVGGSPGLRPLSCSVDPATEHCGACREPSSAPVTTN